MPAPRLKPLSTGPRRTTADAIRDAELRSGRGDRVVSISDVQRLTGYDRATVARWISKGRNPEPGKGPKGAIQIDLRHLMDWREEQARIEERRKVPEATEDLSSDPDIEFKREQIKFQKIKTAERVALLVPASTVTIVVATILSAFRTAIDSLPDRIERDLVDFPSDIVRKAKGDARAHCRAALRSAQRSLDQGVRRITKDRLAEVGAEPDDEFDAEDEIEDDDHGE